MFVDFEVIRVSMLFNPSLQLSVCLTNIGTEATGQEFIHNRALERFRRDMSILICCDMA